MNDSWIDKDELDDLVSGFSNGQRAATNQQLSGPEDLFDDIPTIHMPRSGPHYQPPIQQQPAHMQQPVQMQQPIPSPVHAQQSTPQPNPMHQQLPHEPSPLQVLVNRSNEPVGEHPPEKVASPFSIDDDDELEDIESQIELLASETAKAMQTLQEVRAKADRNGLIAETRPKTEPEIQINETVIESDGDEDAEYEEEEFEEEEFEEPLDRIPLDVEIDAHLSLRGRLKILGEILEKYVGMEEMTVIDRDGFTLYSTKESSNVEKGAGSFLKAIRKVYDSNSRSHTASQLAVENGKWLCIVPTDGEIDGRFLLKALMPTPLDRPEIYVLVEMLNEVLRPES